MDASKDLGRAIVTALTRLGALLQLQQAVASREGVPLVVSAVKVFGDGRIVVTDSMSRKPEWVVTGVTAKDLAIGEDLTLHDLVVAGRGDLYIGHGAHPELTNAELLALVDRIELAPLAVPDQTLLTAADARSWALATLIEGANCPAEAGTARAVTCAIHEWFAEPSRSAAFNRLESIAQNLSILTSSKAEYDRQRAALSPRAP